MGPRLSDLCPGEVTVLSRLSERRDSSSTLSSAYTLSRRSSGIISQCFSSRRSSGASQYGGGGSALGFGRPNNVSSADSYDPISADLSRRSSEASQGAPVSLSLTPAQHYRLRAKYAAATGGAPPTPLPNVEHMTLRGRVALMGDGSGAVATGYPYGHAPTAAAPRRCSDGGYANVSMMPHEAPGRLPRRASDPVRRAGLEPLTSPQRFNSLSHMTCQQPMGLPERRQLSLQGYVRSDGNGNLHCSPPYAPRPPSISENVAMETGEDELMLLDDVVQYITAGPETAQNPPVNRLAHPSQGFHGNSPPVKQQQQSCLYQRRAAVMDANLNTSPARQPALCHVSPRPQQHGHQGQHQLQGLNGHQGQQQLQGLNGHQGQHQLQGLNGHQGHPPSPASGRASLPLQWNEVSSGSGSGSGSGPGPGPADGPPGQAKQSFGSRDQENLQPKQNMSPCQNRQVRPLSQNLGLTTASAAAAHLHHHHPHHQGLHAQRASTDFLSQRPGGADFLSQRPDCVQTQRHHGMSPGEQLQLRLRLHPPHGCSQGLASAHVDGNGPQMQYPPCGSLAGSGPGSLAVGTGAGEGVGVGEGGGGGTSAELHSSRLRPQLTAVRSYTAFPASQENSSQTDANHNNHIARTPPRLPHLHGNQELMQPRPPTEPKSSSQRLIGPNPTQQHPDFPQSAFGLGYGSSSPEASPKKAGIAANGNTVANSNTDANDNTVFYTAQIHMFESDNLNLEMSSCILDNADNSLVTMASPGTNQVSSTVESIHGLEQPQIDFDTLLDDGDHSSLMSGTISPSILRNLSQNSSRLTTPRNSVTLPSVPAGIGNMAIGDMTSMLSSLAQESKFLNMMS